VPLTSVIMYHQDYLAIEGGELSVLETFGLRHGCSYVTCNAKRSIRVHSSLIGHK
jgi:hypothetical protein